MQMSLSTRRNHMGRRWILPSSSSVARLAMSVIERSLVDLVGTEDWGLVCGGVWRAACHNIPPLVADLPNETKIKNGGIY